MSKQSITEIDRHVSRRLAVARKLAGLSLEKVAAAIGLTFQQIQKYEKAGRSERGGNRVSAGKLAVLAQLYHQPVSWFFEGMPGNGDAAAMRMESTSTNGAGEDIVTGLITAPGGVDLARDYIALAHNKDRHVVASVARALAGRS